MNIIYLLVSLLPIIGPLILLVILKQSAKIGMTVSMLLMIILGIFVWGIDMNVIFASIGIGIHKAITIILILFGALALVNTLKNTKAISRINEGFLSITNDKRVLVVLIAFLLGGLIEGASGFGTPATITGPLMVAIGLNPFTAAVLALVSDSVAVSFGAVGVPISVGLSNVNVAGIEVANYITLIDLFAGVFIPLMVVILYVVLSGKYQSSKLKSIKEMIPFSMFVGVLYTLMAFMTSRVFGFEFVSIISPIVTLVIVSLTSRKGFLLPKGSIIQNHQNEMSLFKAWSPYIVVILLLIMTRVVPPIKDFLLSIDFLSIKDLLGTSLKSDFAILYSPGTVLLIASIFASLYQTKSISAFKKSVTDSKDVLIGAAMALIPTLILVTVFSNSHFNANDLVSMPNYIASNLANVFGTNWNLISPFLGALGSFVTGSATVSSLTFAEVQASIATNVGLSTVIILALQVIGAAIGNMICVHNVVAASAVVGLTKQEGMIIKKTIIPALIYLLLVVVVGIILL